MNKAPKVAAVHDLSGFGRCALTVALPVLAAMGAQCCPMPTAFLSAHTGFPDDGKLVFHDMTDQMPGIADHWAALGVAPDAIYTGFLGSTGQVDHLLDFLTRFRKEDTLVLVDPVMGDHGKPYRTCTPELRARLAELATEADIITPNLTEAALLLGEDYQENPGPATLCAWLGRLSLAGRRSVVITGVSTTPRQLGAACLERESGTTSYVMAPRENGSYPGTGDLFASVLLGALLRGEALPIACKIAVHFVQHAVRRTLALGTPVQEGVQFEGLLGELTQPK